FFRGEADKNSLEGDASAPGGGAGHEPGKPEPTSHARGQRSPRRGGGIGGNRPRRASNAPAVPRRWFDASAALRRGGPRSARARSRARRDASRGEKGTGFRGGREHGS